MELIDIIKEVVVFLVFKPRGGVLDQKIDGGVRTENLKKYIFSDIDPYLQIFDEYFATFLSVFVSFYMIVREFDSNYEILYDNWRL